VLCAALSVWTLVLVTKHLLPLDAHPLPRHYKCYCVVTVTV
jgi:hypothetical protein